MIIVALINAAIWIYLLAARGGFWRSLDLDESIIGDTDKTWQSVIAIVPARNEVDVIARSIQSLLMQDYEGSFAVILVDDNSDDGTARVARLTATKMNCGDRFSVIQGLPLPEGWTGKLWALSQGVEAASDKGPIYYWLSDPTSSMHQTL